MIHIPEQSENPELPPHPKSEPTINSEEGKKAWNENEAELAKEYIQISLQFPQESAMIST